VPATDPPLPPPGDAVQRIEPHKVRIELSTLRRVWLRVTVDGRLVMEREADAGERIPFGGDRSIMVRAGDAGAVLVRAGGGEQAALGRDGQVLTRAFPASAP
jgi:predicted polyphosphate/ATP-dependent NAD kinase